jgi:hypothetical protein
MWDYQSARRSFQAEKLELLKVPVLNTVSTTASEDVIALFMGLVDELTVPHIKALREMANHEIWPCVHPISVCVLTDQPRTVRSRAQAGGHRFACGRTCLQSLEDRRRNKCLQNGVAEINVVNFLTCVDMEEGYPFTGDPTQKYRRGRRHQCGARIYG